MIFLRDSDGDLWIEIPGRPGMFATTADFQRGRKYVDMWMLTRAAVEADGPATVEWEIAPQVSEQAP